MDAAAAASAAAAACLLSGTAARSRNVNQGRNSPTK